MRGDSRFGDTVNPELVHTTCEGCGESFETSESAAHARDQRGEPHLCDRCKHGRKPAPSQSELENPTPDAIHERRGVGPDAEPDIRAEFPVGFEFGDIVTAERVPLTIKKGTETLGRVTVRPGVVEGLYIQLNVTPDFQMLDGEVSEAVVKALSQSTQKLIEFE